MHVCHHPSNKLECSATPCFVTLLEEALRLPASVLSMLRFKPGTSIPQPVQTIALTNTCKSTTAYGLALQLERSGGLIKKAGILLAFGMAHGWRSYCYCYYYFEEEEKKERKERKKPDRGENPHHCQVYFRNDFHFTPLRP